MAGESASVVHVFGSRASRALLMPKRMSRGLPQRELISFNETVHDCTVNFPGHDAAWNSIDIIIQYASYTVYKRALPVAIPYGIGATYHLLVGPCTRYCTSWLIRDASLQHALLLENPGLLFVASATRHQTRLRSRRGIMSSPMKRRGSLANLRGAETEDSPEPTQPSTSSCSAQLEASKMEMQALFHKALGGVASLVDRAAASQIQAAATAPSVEDILKVQMASCLDTLSEVHVNAGREQVAKIRTSLQMKMQAQRTASERQLQQQAVAMEATFHREFEGKVRAMVGDSGAALEAANRQVEELKQEMNGMRIKAEGTEQALAMAQQLYKASEAKVASLETVERRLGLLEEEIESAREALACAPSGMPSRRQDQGKLDQPLARSVQCLIESYEEAQARHERELQAQIAQIDAAQDQVLACAAVNGMWLP